MKNLIVGIILGAVLILCIPWTEITLQAAVNASERDILERDIRIYQLEIIARQERIQRFQQEIQVWQEELRKAADRMRVIKEEELRKQEEEKIEPKENKP